MKKAICISLIALFLAAGLAFSQEVTEETDTSMGKGMMHKEMMMQGEKEGKHDKYNMMKMMGMMNKQMVATQDAGVAILYGNTLLKYDKNLKLIKEVEIDFKSMKKKWMEKCAKHKQMLMQKEEAQEEAAE